MATVQKRSRQSRALDMLEAQLKSGVKTEKKTKDVKVPLTDSDRKRIAKEMEILKANLV
jgi:NAD(P)H-dependent FMN reductase